jgi:hypothetical protein
MSQNQEMNMNQKQPVPAKICAPNVKIGHDRLDQIVYCSKWLHGLCGKKVIRKNKESKWGKSPPPTVGHLNSPPGQIAKKVILKNEKQQCLRSHIMLSLFFPYSPLYSLSSLYVRK